MVISVRGWVILLFGSSRWFETLCHVWQGEPFHIRPGVTRGNRRRPRDQLALRGLTPVKAIHEKLTHPDLRGLTPSEGHSRKAHTSFAVPFRYRPLCDSVDFNYSRGRGEGRIEGWTSAVSCG